MICKSTKELYRNIITNMPWADGTECGAEKWCQRRKCINKKIPETIDGGWSQFKP